MEEWKVTLKNRVRNMVFSKSINDFHDVVKAFRERYNELTQDIEDSKSDPLLVETSSDEHAEFSIDRYGLGVRNDFESGEIHVTYKENDQSTTLALIHVNKEFATVKVPEEVNDYYLSPEVIDELFKKAYEPMTV